MIDHIEVVSVRPVFMVSGATGGIINIITKRADKSEPVSFQTKLGVTSADNFRGDSWLIKWDKQLHLQMTKSTVFLA
jgi:iron complex outermembrane receptor protein